MIDAVVVLDMDGVILRTSEVKVRAMQSLFAGYTGLQSSIRDYILANTGVPRREKIVTILRDIVKVDAAPGEVARCLERYGHALEADLVRAAMVEGVEAFIRSTRHRLYVSSSAPDDEVRAQLERRGLTDFFVRVFGETTRKPDALRAVLHARRGRPVVFFGDSRSDHEAARQAGTAFVGVTAEADHFGARTDCKLASFADIAEVERVMARALTQRSPASA